MLHVTPLSAGEFCASIEKALEMAIKEAIDLEECISRIRKTIRGLPEGSLIVSDQGSRVTFFSVVAGKQRYLSKKDDRIYSLARRRYLTTLLEILMLLKSNRKSDVIKRKKLIQRLQQFIRVCERGHLEVARIILTRKQYKWFCGAFRQKEIDEQEALKTAKGLPVRSKSEKDIINSLDDYAVPLHYEEQLIVFVKPLVEKLRDSLIKRGDLRGNLYTYHNRQIYWNVPRGLEWMNEVGSIWKTYDARKGTITMFNDIKIIFADGTLFLQEHEGMMDNFYYRCNASERASILKYLGVVDKEHFLETYEHDIDSPEKRKEIIEREILPRLWF